MNSNGPYVRLLVIAGTACVAASALAQSSVTLYGIVDAGLVYQSSQTSLGSTADGRSVVKLGQNIWNGNRVGIKGQEDLGGGAQAIFTLESGFNLLSGTQQFANGEFSRQAFVGLADASYGSLTVGRQYTSYYSLVGPYGPTTWLTGYFGAHAGDIDNLDVIYRVNNSLVYTSPVFYGVTVSGTYAFGGVAGSVSRGSSWSAAIQYAKGPLGLAAGIERFNNSTPGGGAWGADSTVNSGGEPGVSALTNGYQTAAAQQRIAIAGFWAFTSAWSMSASCSNVQYIPGAGSAFRDQATFNTAGAALHFGATAALNLAAGYSITRATRANGITSPAQYQQFNLAESYNLSKRTMLYALQGFQRSHGQTLGTGGAGDVIGATATIGDGFNAAPSSSRSQFATALAITHRF
ncbi:Gram-negative porin (plasmid) [Caballeronia sp. SBC1]|uniref:porin n=1 Tax=unclassified Caballeronia TaxID=2646786 RepID=UPI0013E1CF71|nr:MULTISPECIES: porin [unclassified Caballeronia]QIE27256.1 Gram-negative porin [Caballeronia sp. SBC2]QIN65265.1 Gram-negative porin [Caballeronia sp. SBC1]